MNECLISNDRSINNNNNNRFINTCKHNSLECNSTNSNSCNVTDDNYCYHCLGAQEQQLYHQHNDMHHQQIQRYDSNCGMHAHSSPTCVEGIGTMCHNVDRNINQVVDRDNNVRRVKSNNAKSSGNVDSKKKQLNKTSCTKKSRGVVNANNLNNSSMAYYQDAGKVRTRDKQWHPKRYPDADIDGNESSFNSQIEPYRPSAKVLFQRAQRVREFKKTRVARAAINKLRVRRQTVAEKKLERLQNTVREQLKYVNGKPPEIIVVPMGYYHPPNSETDNENDEDAS